MLVLELKSVGKQTKSSAQLTIAVCYISRDVVNTPDGVAPQHSYRNTL